MRAFFALFACTVGLAQPVVSQEIPGPVPAEILHIVDGDTVGVRAHTWPGQYVEIRVRLRGVDAPEIRRVACEAERVKGQEATQFTRNWLTAPGGDGFAPVMLTEIGPDSFWPGGGPPGARRRRGRSVRRSAGGWARRALPSARALVRRRRWQ